MDSSLPLKLAIGIVVVFGLLLAGMWVYEPLWYAWHGARLASDDAAVQEAAAKKLAARGERAIPHIREWLKSPIDRKVIGACLALEKMEGDAWKGALAELDEILNANPSEKTNAAASLLFSREYIYDFAKSKFTWKRFEKSRAARFNISMFGLSHEDWRLRTNSAYTLSKLGDARAVVPLIVALGNDWDADVRLYAADALGAIGDNRAAAPLIRTLEKDNDSDVREWSGVALSHFDGEEVISMLEAAVRRKNLGATVVLAWKRGGADLEVAAEVEMEIDNSLLEVFLADARARWGNADAIEEIVDDLPYVWYGLARFHADVFSRMPEGFPKFDFKANYATRKKQAAKIREWYEKHKHRLAWDAEKRRYYLRNEAGEKP